MGKQDQTLLQDFKSVIRDISNDVITLSVIPAVDEHLGLWRDDASLSIKQLVEAADAFDRVSESLQVDLSHCRGAIADAAEKSVDAIDRAVARTNIPDAMDTLALAAKGLIQSYEEISPHITDMIDATLFVNASTQSLLNRVPDVAAALLAVDKSLSKVEFAADRAAESAEDTGSTLEQALSFLAILSEANKELKELTNKETKALQVSMGTAERRLFAQGAEHREVYSKALSNLSIDLSEALSLLEGIRKTTDAVSKAQEMGQRESADRHYTYLVDVTKTREENAELRKRIDESSVQGRVMTKRVYGLVAFNIVLTFALAGLVWFLQM